MVAQNLLDAVLSLGRGEQVELFEWLRDRLTSPDPAATDLSDGGVSDEHRRVLDERFAAYERDPTAGVPWEAIEARLTARLGAS